MVDEEQDATFLVNKQNVMRVETKDERGMILSKEYGFTVEEENGKVLSFDLINHPDLGITLLFGEQVFVLKFWDDDALSNGLSIVAQAITQELERRKNEFRKTSE